MPKAEKLWELHRSPIHRKGMFAAADIPAGTPIVEYVGQKIDKDESLERCLEQEKKGAKSGGAKVFIFDLNDDWDLDGNVPNNPAKYINHSCDENCEAINDDDHIWIYAKKDIAKGNELTFDYGYDIEHYEEHPCECGSKRCCGYIVAKSQRRQLKKRLAEKTTEARKAEKAQKAAEAKAAKEKERAAREEERSAQAKKRRSDQKVAKKVSAKPSKESKGTRKTSATKKSSASTKKTAGRSRKTSRKNTASRAK